MCSPQRRVGYEREGDLNGVGWFSAAQNAGDLDGVPAQVPDCCGRFDGLAGYLVTEALQALPGLPSDETRALSGVERVERLGSAMTRVILSHVEGKSRAEVAARTESTLADALATLGPAWPSMVGACATAVREAGVPQSAH